MNVIAYRLIDLRYVTVLLFATHDNATIAARVAGSEACQDCPAHSHSAINYALLLPEPGNDNVIIPEVGSLELSLDIWDAPPRFSLAGGVDGHRQL